MNYGFTHRGLLTQSYDEGNSIDSRHPSYIAMGPKYRLINTLLGGSAAMRAAAEVY